MRHFWGIVMVLLVAVAPAAHADQKDSAKAALAEGVNAFRLGDFDAAIAAFKKSYELSPTPVALYNLAQVFRQKKDTEHALFFYQEYLSEFPNAPDRDTVERRIKELKDLAAEERAVHDKPPDGVRSANHDGAVETVPASQPRPVITGAPIQPVVDSDSRPWYPWLIGGIGVAAVATGIGFFLWSSNLDTKAQNSTSAMDALSLQDDADSKKRLGTVFTIAGGVVLATGIVLLVVNPHSHHPDRTAQVSLGLGFRTITLAGTF